MTIKQTNGISIICIACIIWLMNACANISAPTGGPKDTTPPILKKRSVADSAKMFTGGKMQFEFNEFIKLQDAAQQLVMSPLPKNKPTISVNKKTVTIFIPDSIILPQTTYRISLGNAIQDLHESNPAQPIQITFSSGNFFDSLTLHGKVIEAETGNLDTAAWVVLYESPTIDSALYKQQPLYVEKAIAGSFQFKYLPKRLMEIFVLHDQNGNFKYDKSDENIGFYSRSVMPGDTSHITIYSFREKNNADTSQTRSKPGFNSPRFAGNQNSLSLQVNIDTTQIQKRTFDITDSIRIQYPPSLTIDKNKVRLYQGNILDASSTMIQDTQRNLLLLYTEWVPDATYQLQIQKGFAKDTSGKMSAAITYNFRTKMQRDYGSLLIMHSPAKHQVAQIYLQEKIIAQQLLRDTQTIFTLLNPGSYQLRILQDDNENMQFDTGQLIPPQMPEHVMRIPELITIKSNWDYKIDLRKSIKQ